MTAKKPAKTKTAQEERAMLTEGQKAPLFHLPTYSPAEGEQKLRLSALKGKNVVLFFYPKDDTSGCTTEAIAFTGLAKKFDKLNTVLIGLSPDSVAKHEKFTAKHKLNVTLAADEEKQILEKYGVWVEKKMYGRTYMGVERSTFLIDEKGKIAKIWRKVKVAGHAEDVLQATKELAG